ncbi:MAG: alpha-amylase [Acidobacteria bacterium]|nr:alpha-amylase [Acidobacteriota bacterium]
MEFHISRSIRERVDLSDLLFGYTGNVIFANVNASRKLAERLRALQEVDGPEKTISGAQLFAMGLIDELSHALIASYRKHTDPLVLADGLRFVGNQVGDEQRERLLLRFTEEFPNVAVFRGDVSAKDWLLGRTENLPNREAAFEELLLLWLANTNPAFSSFGLLFGDRGLKTETAYAEATASLPEYFETRPPVAGSLGTLLQALQAPMIASPDSLTGQLDYIREHWAPVLGEDLSRVLLAVDVLREEEIAVWMQFHPAGPVWHRHGDPSRGGEGFVGDEFIGFEEDFITLPDGTRRRRYAQDYQAPLNEYEAFSADQAWMPTVVLMAKNTYVWLEQLSKKYGRHIHRLDQIPDEELRLLAHHGINGLWLIGLWERSRASRIIKRLRGNNDAVASAYSLKDYRIAEDLGGEDAYMHLRNHAASAGIRLASDMVPNHMGIDSDWVIEHPDWFLHRHESPFPVYTFDGPDVSTDSRVEIKIEDHYYDHSDAAVVFRLRHHSDGRTRFVYHGNDGTTFAWNDTAQLDYSKAEVREHVIQIILNVARRFPIIRFDAAMVLAKRHVQRLWFPVPGAGGSIPSRAEDAMSDEAFNALMPHEFWREVVDRVAVEVPGTLLLAEAFWLLEGYFVRTLGMHRVYNSAFMNMLRDEENAKYRSYLKKTVEFDPDILKRYVNFMSNPDERTAFDQFGSGDKYFGVCVLLATLPGLPMFGHGQIEGFTERYGMDFKQARIDEYPNQDLVARHDQLIAPLLKNRHLFAESTYFLLYDFWKQDGTVDENVFAYSNRFEHQRGVIFYNNSYGSTYGTIHFSVGFLDKTTGAMQQQSLSGGLNLPDDDAVVIAYADTVAGLEYLRRAKDVRDHGLSLSLRGYQHVALLHWRELRSTAVQPWDRLCDALNGSGVYNLDEALSKLQVRPLLEALRGAVSTTNIDLFSRLSRELTQAGSSTAASQMKPARGSKKKAALSEASVPPDPRLNEFVGHANVFLTQLLALPELEGRGSSSSVWTSEATAALPTKVSDGLQGDELNVCGLMATASLHLPTLVAGLPERLRIAGRTVLPGEGAIELQQGWAPVLVWLVLHNLASRMPPIEIFDTLNLRWALAETFSSVGLKGEAAWKAAAQISVLLRFIDQGNFGDVIETKTFWEDADVRWLAGVNLASGVEYINQERFEELLCWLMLPEMINIARTEPIHLKNLEPLTSMAVTLSDLLMRSRFEYQTFIGALGHAFESSSVPKKVKS